MPSGQDFTRVRPTHVSRTMPFRPGSSPVLGSLAPVPETAPIARRRRSPRGPGAARSRDPKKLQEEAERGVFSKAHGRERTTQAGHQDLGSQV